MIPRKTAAGFTLIEVLLAITLTAMICAVLYGVVYSTLSVQHEISGYNEAAVVADRIADMIAEDLQSAYVADYDGKSPFFAQNHGVLRRHADRLTMITGTPQRMPAREDEKAGIMGFREVSYVAVPSSSRRGYLALYRREAPLDENTARGGQFALLHDQVESFDLRFVGKEDEIDWEKAAEDWEFSSEEGLPRAVLLSLTVSVGGKVEEPRPEERDVNLPYRRQEIYRVLALPPGMDKDTTKLAALEPGDPRGGPGTAGTGRGGKKGGPGGGVNPLLQNLPRGARPRGGGGNPLLQLLRGHQRGR